MSETHETSQRTVNVKIGSERSFGIVFSIVFTIIGVLPLRFMTYEVNIWALGIAVIFLILGVFAPKTLAPLNKAWFKFGLILHKIVNPVVLGLMFFTMITPMALGLRLMGKDPLKRNFDQDAKTYWVDRDPHCPEPKSMRNQF